MSKRVLVFGSSGMAGHVMTLTLASLRGVDVVDVGPRRKVFPSTIVLDIFDRNQIEKLFTETGPDFVVNCVGVLVRESETNPFDAIWLNAAFPHVLSRLCADHDCKLIHVSTDCVFSGRQGPYREDDERDGHMVYDRTKALGEVAQGTDLTIRTSIAGPELDSNGTGLFHWFMTQTGPVTGYARALWSGVMTPQLARFVCHVITSHSGLSGIVHYSTPGGISKYDLLRLFNASFDKNLSITAADTPVIDKRLLSTRPDVPLPPPGYRLQIDDTREWMRNHAKLYGHYETARMPI